MVFLIAASGLFLGSLPLFSFAPLTWHDQHRIGQLALFLVLAFAWCFCITVRVSALRRSTVGLLLVLFILGGLSGARALRPDWAFAEISLLICCIGLALGLATCQVYGPTLLSGFVRGIVGSMGAQFSLSCTAALAHPELHFDPWSLLDGFSNMRHHGQFLTMMLPLLAVAWRLPPTWQRCYSPRIDHFLMLTVATMVFVGGTRGSVAAWLIVAGGFACLGGGARRLALQIVLAIVGGYLLSLGILDLIARATGQLAESRFTGVQVFGLSARELLWQRSLELIAAHPWLGLGPMQFAGERHPFGAHPHQAVLQIAVEWGLPVLALCLLIVGRWLWRAFVLARRQDAEADSDLRWGVLFSISAALVQAQVDGVLVMPYPQLWLAIIAGWALAVFRPEAEPLPSSGFRLPAIFWKVLMLLAALYLGMLAVRDYPKLVNAPEYCASGPRFWCNGGIK